jgi:hypothetical protein
MAAKGEGGQEPLFHDLQSFEAWLKQADVSLLPELCTRIALRACWRPLLDPGPGTQMFNVFRALVTLRGYLDNSEALQITSDEVDLAVRNIVSRNEKIDRIIGLAARTISEVRKAQATNSSKKSATHQAAVAYAKRLATYCLHTAAYNEASTIKPILAASHDAEALQEGETLEVSPLWSDGIPIAIASAFVRFSNDDLVPSNWGVIASWYGDIVAGTDLFGIVEHRVFECLKPTLESSVQTDKADDLVNEIADLFKFEPETAYPELRTLITLSVEENTGDNEENLGQRSRRSDTPPEPQTRDTADTLADIPTAEDKLGRAVFAKAVVERLDDVHAQLKAAKAEDGFALNLHAPWGAGKTSVLKMMEGLLRSRDREPGERWIVVNFNAWRHERRKPPWFPLMDALQKQACIDIAETAQTARHFSVRGHWLSWRFLSDAMALFVGLGIVGAVAGVWWVTRNLEDLGPLLTLGTAVLGLAGGGFALSRTLVFGSDEHANFHLELTRDPLKRVTRVFRSIVEASHGKICVFIDDLDRCDGDYVVTFLEGLQTCFRNRNVIYVVAADRKWIKAAFEKRYGETFGQIHSAGQPIGYMFLEKIFQISLPLPSVSSGRRDAYYQAVLSHGEVARAHEDEALERYRKEVRDSAGARGVTADTAARAERSIDEDETLSVTEKRIKKDAVVLELVASPKSRTEAEHRLWKFRDHAPFNPRVLKRMVNAYTLRLVELELSDEAEMTYDRLARWVVLEQCYPGLADLMAERPDRIAAFLGKAGEPPVAFEGDAALAPFLGDASITAIASHDALGDALTPDAVRLFTAGMR